MRADATFDNAELAARVAGVNFPNSQTRNVRNPTDSWPTLDPIQLAADERAKPFPFSALGAVSGAAAQSIASDVQVPDSIAGGSVLACMSLATQPHADVVLPHGQRSPLSLFLIDAAESGDRKSAADRVALQEVDELRREQWREYAHEVARASEQDKPPPPKSLTVGKATVEGVQMILKSQSHVGLITAEGAELLCGHSMRDERRSAGLAWFLKAWSGETLDSLTRGDGLWVLLSRRVCMHAMVQPVLLRGLISDPLAREQGLLARCLIAQPASLAGTRLFRDVNPSESASVRAFHARIRHLLRMPLPLNIDGDGYELSPRAISLSVESRNLWIEFYDEIERQQAAAGQLSAARAFASKTAEQAARIAAVVQMVEAPDAGEIDAASMECGAGIAEFYLSEHVRLTGASQASERDLRLRALFAWMRSHGPDVPHNEVLRRSPNSVRTLKASGINPLLDELVQRGYIRRKSNNWEVRPNVD